MEMARSRAHHNSAKTKFEEFIKEAKALGIARVKITGYLKGNDRRNSSRITLYCYVSPLDAFKPEYGEKIASISARFSRGLMVTLLEADFAALYSKKAAEWKKSLKESGITCLVHERPFRLF